MAQIAAVDPSLSRAQIGAAMDTVLTSAAVLRNLSAALQTGPHQLAVGAPPVVGALVIELIARGSTTFAIPTCRMCARTGRPLTCSVVDGEPGGVCARCRRWQLATACIRCGVIKPVAGRDRDGQPVCARCQDRPQRECGICGRIRRIALRARDGRPDICDGCFRMPEALCSRCGQQRPCAFADTPHPVCVACTPRRTTPCAHCGADRPPSANWPEGPVCETCYTAALRRRGICAGCGQTRRLTTPPGPSATRCADCTERPDTAGIGIGGHVCADCGREDKLYERGRCAACALARRTRDLLAAGGDIDPALLPVQEAITASRTPRSALNWLRQGAGAPILADLAAGRLLITHQALDDHPHRRAVDYLRHILLAAGVLPDRDEALARTTRWTHDLIAAIDKPRDRHLVQAFATWTVLHRLRRRSERNPRPRTATANARHQIRAAADFLAWLDTRGQNLADAGQGDIEDWLLTGPAAASVRSFLTWAAQHAHTGTLEVPTPARNPGPATDTEQRWAQLDRLLSDDTLEPTDRLAGTLLLLYGQHLSRIAVMTTDQITHHEGSTQVRFGTDHVPLPDPLTGPVQDLLTRGRPYRGIGSPTTSPWLFPGTLPGRPIDPSHLGHRLRRLGIYALPARRAALMHLAGHLPAAVLADLVHIAPGTAVNWMNQSRTNWNQYAAELATPITNTDE